MIEPTKEQEEEWIQFRGEESQRTSKSLLYSDKLGTGKKTLRSLFKRFFRVPDRYEDINQIWLDF